jgi:hypothetical protein
MDVGLYLVLVFVLGLVVAVVVWLETSTLNPEDSSLRGTLRALWHTYFGGGKDLPDDKDRNRRLD